MNIIIIFNANKSYLFIIHKKLKHNICNLLRLSFTIFYFFRKWASTFETFFESRNYFIYISYYSFFTKHLRIHIHKVIQKISFLSRKQFFKTKVTLYQIHYKTMYFQEYKEKKYVKFFYKNTSVFYSLKIKRNLFYVF